MKRFLATLLLIACATASLAQAQGAYPARPVKIVCGFPAGTSLDIITRIYAQKLEESLGQPFVVENRGGASGNLAAEAARARRARRLHPADRRHHAGHQHEPVQDRQLRRRRVISSRSGSSACTPTILVVNAALGVKSVSGAHCARQIAARRAHPRHGRRRHRAAHVGGAVQSDDRASSSRTSPIAAPTRPSSICSAAGCR